MLQIFSGFESQPGAAQFHVTIGVLGESEAAPIIFLDAIPWNTTPAEYGFAVQHKANQITYG